MVVFVVKKFEDEFASGFVGIHQYYFFDAVGGSGLVAAVGAVSGQVFPFLLLVLPHNEIYLPPAIPYLLIFDNPPKILKVQDIVEDLPIWGEFAGGLQFIEPWFQHLPGRSHRLHHFGLRIVEHHHLLVELKQAPQLVFRIKLN